MGMRRRGDRKNECRRIQVPRLPGLEASAERIDWFAAYSRRIDALWDQNGANQDLPLEDNGIYSNLLLSKVVHATSSTVLVSFASARSADSVHLAQHSWL
jgi:hypothetical protein